MRDFQTVRFLSPEHKIQLQTSLLLKQLYIHYSPCTLLNMNYFTPSFAEKLNNFFCKVGNLHCNFHNVENSNCTFYIVEYRTKYFPYCEQYQCFFHKIFLKLFINCVSFVSLFSTFNSSFVANFKPFFPCSRKSTL